MLVSLGVNTVMVSENKTKFLIIYKKRHLMMDPVSRQLRFGNTYLSNESKVRFLGLGLDAKLNRNHHVENTREKAKKLLNILKFSAGHS